MNKLLKIDEIDRNILLKLDENARLSATDISRWLGVSKQRVAFRIRRLVKLGILDLFSTIISKTKLGYFHCQIYLKFRKSPTEQGVFQKLKKIPQLHWEGVTKGNYNLVIFFLVKTMEECWLVYEKIINQFSDNLLKKEIMLTSKTYFLNHSYITDAPRRISISEFPHKEIKLKKRDLDLINAIKEHGRIQINQLAQKIMSTSYTVRQRIAYLKRKGVISAFKVRINHMALGFKHFFVMLKLTGISSSQKESIIQALAQEKETIRITETIGQWDLVVDLILLADKKPTEWLRDFLAKKQFLLANIQSNILEIKKVLPINTVIYS